MEQALNSDLPDEVKALIPSNVYDTATGRYVLIPQGARLVGEYNSPLGYGQDGVQVIWNRVIYPDGSSLDLNGMLGQDAHGLSGFRDKVDRHYKRLLGFAVLTSLFAAASEVSQNRNRSYLSEPCRSCRQRRRIASIRSRGADYTKESQRSTDNQNSCRLPLQRASNRDVLFNSPYNARP